MRCLVRLSKKYYRVPCARRRENLLTTFQQLRQMAERRKADPAVLQDIPQIPAADELEQAEASNVAETGAKAKAD